jgi:uncharacterized repeat protein (TIGR04076 family)
MKYLLYDLKVTIQGDPETFSCSHRQSEGLIFQGENFTFLKDTKMFSHYAFAALIPFIAAKQRVSDEKDWMYYENSIACPDPLCGAQFKIERLARRVYEYGDA